ncbi:zinc finger C2HC domain-containing protein 1B-like [Tigriopus californicus]|uniref:zinc finger C2HC domain-containing protein 1B-like n=1 Tax=Tigriopus californicus TaxID=6832 RepID=UPI0027DA691C|nr:zinc finger C2HC domain-containing protein 1B-like [Tigriopus californicus]|eukprot:TCALIF_12473-PA protein Name:"Similar to zc2hc1a Zinc finger C2HC domain-containing protein 1A (Danio rerio)" AED:0.00 eAED:0.00 QI:179/1/1/1/1/1/2/145/139
MGGGASKKDTLAAEGATRERRPSHIDTNPPPKSDILVECGTCLRKFAADRIGRHAEVCAKTAQKDRGIFDVQEQRLKGTEAEDLKDEIANMEVTRVGSSWKEKREKQVLHMREAKKHNRPVSALDNIEIVTNKSPRRHD